MFGIPETISGFFGVLRARVGQIGVWMTNLNTFEFLKPFNSEDSLCATGLPRLRPLPAAWR